MSKSSATITDMLHHPHPGAVLLADFPEPGIRENWRPAWAKINSNGTGRSRLVTGWKTGNPLTQFWRD